MTKRWLAIGGGLLCACAGEAALRPVQRTEARASGSEGVPPGDGTAEKLGAPRTPEEIRRCPDPYGDEGTGWIPKARPSEDATRAMNERHGLVCLERPADARQVADGVDRVWGCVDQRGTVIIPFVYSRLGEEAFYFAESGLALVFEPREGWLYIDATNRKVGQAETLDNTPDEAFGGYARFRNQSGKIGYLDPNRRIAIPAQYDAAFPFAKCAAQVCMGCHPNRWKKEAAEEADCSGEAFVIDQSGKRLTGRLPSDAAYCADKRASTTQK